MAKRRPKSKSSSRRVQGERSPYAQARKRALDGNLPDARRRYEAIDAKADDSKVRALVKNDLAALDAQAGRLNEARAGFESALALDPTCQAARENLLLLDEPSEAPAERSKLAAQSGAIRVAIVSFLFNWPSTGGGIVHTVELGDFLGRAGYEVEHFYAAKPDWGIGRVEDPLSFRSTRLELSDTDWNAADIQGKFRKAVNRFDPDYVIVTDSWNFKPLLAQALSHYPIVLRFQAMECLCPLNNVRLLPDGKGGFRQCEKHQLATAADCRECVHKLQGGTGSLHRADRELAGYGSEEYDRTLREALRSADTVLVVNPLHEAMFAPYCRQVQVVTAGMDKARFPSPLPAPAHPDGRLAVFCAAVVEEPMKGFRVLHEACRRLWQKRKDFRLVATGDPPGDVDEFTTFVGWLSQDALAEKLREIDVCVIPTIAQEALGRTAVEAMAAGRPVVASAIGGLPFTVADGATGLLAAPGNPDDLAQKIEQLLDDPALREQLGKAGRKRFESHFSWDVIIERHYKSILHQKRPRASPKPSHPATEAALRQQFAWPAARPQVSLPDQHTGWLEDGAKELLRAVVTPSTRLVLELGIWLGLSTRYMADLAPQATIATVDHWKGSPEHQKRPEWKSMLPTLYETFLAANWDYRDRIVPLRMSTLEGIQAVARHGLSPDVVFIDAEHSYASVRSELALAYELFPSANLTGDDYDAPDVARAVEEFAKRHGLVVTTYGRNWRAWRLSKDEKQLTKTP